MANNEDGTAKKIPYDARMSPELNAKRERLNWHIDEVNKAKNELIDHINSNKEQFGLEANQHVTDIKPGPNSDWDHPVIKIETD